MLLMSKMPLAGFIHFIVFRFYFNYLLISFNLAQLEAVKPTYLISGTCHKETYNLLICTKSVIHEIINWFFVFPTFLKKNNTIEFILSPLPKQNTETTSFFFLAGFLAVKISKGTQSCFILISRPCVISVKRTCYWFELKILSLFSRTPGWHEQGPY